MSAEARWQRTREESTIPSEPSTPVPDNVSALDHASTAAPQESSLQTMSPSIPASSGMNIDADDEDVKIAIMALGAMKNLDGRSRSGAEIHSGKNTAKTSTSSAMSTSSFASTAISSPATSTPGTEVTYDSIASTSSPPRSGPVTRKTSVSTTNSSSDLATLADLPADFEFPAIVHDENGNEVRVDWEDMADDDFFKRVSHLPIVRGTLKAYELGKQKSRVVKYGGDLVESSVKAISRPVVSRLGARLGGRGVEQLDDFACRQLNRIYPASDQSPSKEERQMILQELDDKEKTEWKHMDDEERSKRRKAYWALRWEEKERELMVKEMKKREEDKVMAATSAPSVDSAIASQSGSRDSRSQQGAPLQALVRAHTEMQSNKAASGGNNIGGSGWGSILIEAGVTAGGLSAAMSEESMKSLKYCLQWLQYATAHIEHQITILRDLIVKLNHGELDLSSPASQNLSAIKGDVVNTIRGVVDVVGKYAGGALPEPARSSVKAFILSLPARWATVNRAPSTFDSQGRQGSFGGSPSSPSFSSAHVSDHHGRTSTSLSSASVAQQHAAATVVAANRVMTLAVESLDILRSVTVVFGESLDRADLWVERLRILGLQRKRAHEQAAAEEAVAGIDVGMGGALTRGNWDNVRSIKNTSKLSPSAESNTSWGTSASAKRRRTKKKKENIKFRTSASPKPAQSDDELVSDEGSLTETEKAATMVGRGAGIITAQGGVTTSSHHPHHQYQGTSSYRRIKGKGSGKISSARTPSASNTPMMHELSLHDHTDPHGKHGGTMQADQRN
ncbi:hypothetical protein CBS101457_002036 [Exobasidium rhododendri]|nr:hypothetical protein CBS101457_002036 [Exobasidium rhododendri]